MKVLFALSALFGAMFGRVVYLYLEARAAYRRRARRPSGVRSHSRTPPPHETWRSRRFVELPLVAGDSTPQRATCWIAVAGHQPRQL